jgi:hypothetical protein
MLTPVVDCDQELYTGAQRRRDVVVSHQPPDCSPCEGTSQRSTCKRCTDVFSAAPIPSTACCSFYLQYSVVASGEESQNCINPYAKPPSLKALRRRLRGSHAALRRSGGSGSESARDCRSSATSITGIVRISAGMFQDRRYFPARPEKQCFYRSLDSRGRGYCENRSS